MTFSYLALGDSYTIGEAVPLLQSFPYQVVQLLRAQNIPVAAPEIIAKTGWTTGELATAMKDYRFLESYNAVSLLIGVNNQYRGLSIDAYETEFKNLLQKAIALAGGNPQHVVVLSIPDYSVTPFAKTKDILKIRQEINLFNSINKVASEALGVPYINITESSREAKNDVNLLAEDGLHPSAAAYNNWADLVAASIKPMLQ